MPHVPSFFDTPAWRPLWQRSLWLRSPVTANCAMPHRPPNPFEAVTRCPLNLSHTLSPLLSLPGPGTKLRQQCHYSCGLEEPMSTWKRSWNSSKDYLSITTADNQPLRWWPAPSAGFMDFSDPFLFPLPGYSPRWQQIPALFSSLIRQKRTGYPRECGEPFVGETGPLVAVECLSQFARGAFRLTHLVLFQRNIWLLYS